MSGFKVDIDGIRAAGQGLTAAGESFMDRVTAFESAAAGYDGAWGDDTIGTYIGAAYSAVADWAFDCWQAIGDELASAGDDLVGMADAYDETETQVASAFETIGRNLG